MRTEPKCTVDAGALDALANGCVVVLDTAFESDACSRALEAVVASGRTPDGGACPNTHVHSVTLGGWRAARVKGRCVRKTRPTRSSRIPRSKRR